MNNALKTGLLTLALGITLAPVDAGAAVATHLAVSNAVNHCQAFTPGPANTIRNRVIGSENIGSTIAVACNFSAYLNGAAGNSLPTKVDLFFTNAAAAPANVSCTMLTGASAGISAGVVYSVTKNVTIAAGGASVLSWGTADNPNAGATDMGNYLVGVNCALPTNMIISATQTFWQADNGV